MDKLAILIGGVTLFALLSFCLDDQTLGYIVRIGAVISLLMALRSKKQQS